MEMTGKRESYSTSCQHKDGSVTNIRVYFDPAAREYVERNYSEPERQIERCVWRTVGVNNDAVVGDSVEFEIRAEDAERLCRELEAIDSASKTSG